MELPRRAFPSAPEALGSTGWKRPRDGPDLVLLYSEPPNRDFPRVAICSSVDFLRTGTEPAPGHRAGPWLQAIEEFGLIGSSGQGNLMSGAPSRRCGIVLRGVRGMTGHGHSDRKQVHKVEPHAHALRRHGSRTVLIVVPGVRPLGPRTRVPKILKCTESSPTHLRELPMCLHDALCTEQQASSSSVISSFSLGTVMNRLRAPCRRSCDTVKGSDGLTKLPSTSARTLFST
jgi:hypothetical protein